MPSPLSPIIIEQEKIDSWPTTAGLALNLAGLLATSMPKGKSSLPRAIGRSLFSHSRSCLRTASGALLAVDPLQLDIYTTIMLADGKWNPHVLRTCLNALRSGDVFLDIGASVGMMSIEVASHMKDEVQILSFEPQQSLTEKIALSAALNGFSNLTAYAVSLGKETGEATLFLPSHSVHASFVSRERNAQQITCRVEPLDTLVNQELIPAPQVMKIDVEGAEFEVLQGGQETIAEHQPFVVFEADENMQRFGYGRQELYEFFVNCAAYRFCYVGETRLYPVVDNLEDMTYSDIVAVPPRQEISLEFP